MREKSKTPHHLGLFGKASRPRSFKRAGHLRTLSTLIAGLSLAAVAAPAATFVSGYLNYEYYPGKVRDDVNNGTAGDPSTAGAVNGSDKSGPVSVLESGTNFADNYANRFVGYFIPPVAGDYVFFIAADDDSDLFLSTDATAENKKLIAQEAGWSPVRSYLTIGGTSLPEDKRSDTFAGSQWTPTPGKITLSAGQKYYIEAVHHEGGGGDNIAVTYKLASEPDPKNGDAPRLTGSVIGFDAATPPPAATINIKVQPVGGTFYASAPMTLVVGVDSTSTYPIAYQWRKNGTPIPGATGSSYTVGAPAAGDAGSYDVVASIPGPTGAAITATSTPVNVTVTTPQVTTETGKLRYEYFPGADRAGVEAGTAASGGAGSAGNDGTGFITIAESGTNFADSYANRISGYFIAPSTADYIFFIAGDDDTDLFLSTDATVANKKLIAQESGWSGVRVYNNVGGGSSIENKRSDSFAASQWPGAVEGAGATIHLTQGQKYYFEAVHHEGSGGDNLAVTYRTTTEDEGLTADGQPPRLTGAVIGVDVPKIFTFSSIGTASISALKFSIADSAPSILDPASVKVTFDGAVLPAIAGTKSADGVTPFTANYPTALAQGSSHIFTLEAKDTNGQPLTQSGTFTIGFQVWPKADLVGAPVAEKKINSRFIFGVKDGAGNNVTISGLPYIMKILEEAGKPSFTDGTNPNFTGVIVDAETDVINWASGGIFGNNLPYPDAVISDPNWTGDQFINLNIINVVIPEEGDYTFGVHSDDGCAMRIRGGVAIAAGGSGQLDPTDPEVVLEPGDTGDSNTRGIYHLKKGVYRVEFFWWENGGGDNGEFYAAKGAFLNDGDTSTWRLVGDPTPSQELTLLGVDASGWTVISSDPGGDPLNTWADADADLAATGGGAKNYDRLNVGDPDTNAGVDAFPKNTAAADDNFAMKATATLVVPEDGTYVIGFNSDDGAYMKLAGQTFTEIVQNNTDLSVISGDTVTCDCLTGDSGTLATVTLTKGNYPIEFGSFEQGGGAFLAARGAKQPANPVSTIDIPFLAKGNAGSKVQTVIALQATSAAADAGGGGNPNPGQPKLTITKNGASVTITSDNGGTVQSKDSLSAGAWTPVGPAPQTVPITGSAKFFRVQQ